MFNNGQRKTVRQLGLESSKSLPSVCGDEVMGKFLNNLKQHLREHHLQDVVVGKEMKECLHCRRLAVLK